MKRVQPPARDYVPRRSGEIAASLLKAYLFFRHNTYDAGEGCFVPGNLIFHAKEVMQLTYEFSNGKPMTTPDWARKGPWREYFHLLLFRWRAGGAALRPADICEGFPERCPGRPVPGDRKP